MWFNSMIREESARAVRCRLKCHNERNPYLQLPSGNAGYSVGTATVRCEEGGDDVKSARPLRPGRHTCYNGWYRGSLPGDGMPISKSHSQFGSESATRLREAGFASNRASAMAR